MRIVHVILADGRGTIILGAERHILNLAAVQQARGSAVTVIVDSAGELFAEACRRQNVPVITVPGLKHGALRAEFGKLAPEVIHCHIVRAVLQVAPISNQLHIPCVLTLHTNSLIEGDALDISYLMKAKEAGLRFAVISVSNELFNGVEKLGIVSDHYYVPNGTKPKGDPTRSPVASAPCRPNFISVGHLSKVKGLDVAILAMAEIRRRRGGHDCPVINIYGTGSEINYLNEMVIVLSLTDAVKFHGFKLDVLDDCPRTDILLVSSRSETGPLVVLEAMSRGMPIVATKVGEVPQMLPDQRYGRVVPPESIVALADAMESMLEEVSHGHFDPELLIEKHRSSYTTEIMTDRVEAVYENAARNESRVMAAGVA
jgi:glycosyltransferase involved in cell wall biosynthesis